MAKVRNDIEKQSKECFTRFIYAAIEDDERDAAAVGGVLTHSPYTSQSYKNLCRPKDQQASKLTERCTVPAPVQQFIAILFREMLSELASIDPGAEDTTGDICRKLTQTVGDECFTVFMINVASSGKARFGPALRSAIDPSQWFAAQVPALPKYASLRVLTAIICEAFYGFLKVVAWHIGELIWTNMAKSSVTEALFLGTLAQQGLPYIMRAKLQADLRAKPNKKSKKATPAAPLSTPQAPADPTIPLTTPLTTSIATPLTTAPLTPASSTAGTSAGPPAGQTDQGWINEFM
jgi:hypothetical protein